MGAPDWALWTGATLRAIPAPTESWADIVGAIAWPALFGFLIIRYRIFVRQYLTTIADRLERDHIKLGLFELTPNAEVIPLDPEEASEATEQYDPADIQRIEKLFELISDAVGYHQLVAWVGERLPDVNLSDFLTDPAYAELRKEAFEALESKGER